MIYFRYLIYLNIKQDLPKPKALVIHESKLDGVFV